MQLFHFIAAWLFPGAAVSKVSTKATIAEFMEHDNDASSSMAFSVKAAEDSGSSVSSSSSSSSDEHPRFFPSRQQEHSPPASPLCFGAGRSGVGRLLLLRGSRGARARSPTRHDEAAAGVAPAAADKQQHGDVVGRYLRRISRRLRKARRRVPADQVLSPSSGRAAADDTASERAEAVARAIAYCKDTLRRGAAMPPPRPPPSPSLDDWLHDRQEEIIASAAACCDGINTDSHTPSPPRPLAAHFGIERGRVSQPLPPRVVHRDGELAEMQATGKQGMESTCSALSRRDCSILHDCRGESVTMGETAMSSSPSDLAPEKLRMQSSFDEMKLLKIFDGDEEMIGHHFITMQI